MKKFILISIILTVILGLYFTFVQKPWELMCPGIQSHELSTLDKSFRKKVEKVLEKLEKEGISYSLSTYRSPEKQQCYFAISKQIKKYTEQKGLTTTQKGCHNNRKDGTPASYAIDIHHFNGSMEDKANFYKKLRDYAIDEGLESGASWSPTNPVWAKYGLGWDPGHVQVKGCTAKVQVK